MQRGGYQHGSGMRGGESRQSDSTFRPRQQSSFGGRSSGWSGSGGWSHHGSGGGGWKGHHGSTGHGYGYRRRPIFDYSPSYSSSYYPIYDTTTWLGSYGYNRLAPEILYPALYWPTQTYVVSTTVKEPVENVRISSDPHNSISEWNALPNTAIHYGPNNKPTFLFCAADGEKPIQIADNVNGTLARPVLQIDAAKYQCKRQT